MHPVNIMDFVEKVREHPYQVCRSYQTRRPVDMLDIIEIHPDRLEERAHRKYKIQHRQMLILPPGKEETLTQFQDSKWTRWPGNSSTEKPLELLIGHKMNMS